MTITDDAFYKIMKQQSAKFISELVGSGNNAQLIESRVKLLHAKYGRGTLLIHFYTLKDFKARKIESIKHVIKFTHHSILYLAVKTDKLFVINDKILWLPIFWMDQYFNVPSHSSLRFYPMCAFYNTMIVIYKDKTQNHRYYKCLLNISYNIHPSELFKSKLNQFLTSITSIKTSKFKYFKKFFPMFCKQILFAHTIKPKPIDLRTYFLVHSKWLFQNNIEYEKYCISHPDIGQYPLYKKLILIEKFTIDMLYECTMDLQFDHPHKDDAQWFFWSSMLNHSQHRIQWTLIKCIAFYQQFNALNRVMIGLYGSHCSYCTKTMDIMNNNGIKRKQNRYKKCANCEQRYYCSRKCQKYDWNSKHRKYCSVHKILNSLLLNELFLYFD